MKRNWKTFYQVWVRYKDNSQWEAVFATPSPAAAKEYAHNRISFRGVQTVQIRDYWGDSVLKTVYNAGWSELDRDYFGERRPIS
jgi:hypothetical protein